MANLTRAQKKFLSYMQTHNSFIYFTRDKHDKERCYMGRKRINAKAFFFFYADVEYLQLEFTEERMGLKYYYFTKSDWRLQEYLQGKQNIGIIPSF